MIKLFEEGIQAIIPQYTERGDSTYIYTFNKNERIYYCSMRTFIKKLFFFTTTDHIALKTKFKKIGIYQNAPIILKNNIYVKIKVRKPIGKSDGAYGYINIKSVGKITRENGQTILILKDGKKIKSLNSLSTLAKNILIGNNFADWIKSKNNINTFL